MIVLPDRVDEERGLLRESLKKGAAAYESVRLKKDGSPVNVDISNEAFRDSHGRVEFVLSTTLE